MAFELDVSDAGRGILRIADFPDLAIEPLREAIDATAKEVRADVLAAVARSGDGKVYRRGFRRFRGSRAKAVSGGLAYVFHRASAPGEPPASDSGALLRALRQRIGASTKGSVRGAVISAAFYGFMLESGTGSIRPRPALVPAAQGRQAEFVARVQAAIDRAAQQVSPT